MKIIQWQTCLLQAADSSTLKFKFKANGVKSERVEILFKLTQQRSHAITLCTYIYVYIYIYMCVYIYIYI